MNRAELVGAVSDATALPREQVDATLRAVLDQIVAATATGQKTTLTGFGSFQPMDRSARAGRTRPPEKHCKSRRAGACRQEIRRQESRGRNQASS